MLPGAGEVNRGERRSWEASGAGEAERDRRLTGIFDVGVGNGTCKSVGGAGGSSWEVFGVGGTRLTSGMMGGGMAEDEGMTGGGNDSSGAT